MSGEALLCLIKAVGGWRAGSRNDVVSVVDAETRILLLDLTQLCLQVLQLGSHGCRKVYPGNLLRDIVVAMQLLRAI